MIRRKTLRRLRHILVFSVVTWLLNISFPAHVTLARTMTPSTMETSLVAVAPIGSLPVIGDRPMKAPVTTISWSEGSTVSTTKGLARRLTVKATAYSSTVDQTDSDPFTTASGMKVKQGIIALNGVKFGTKVRIPQYFGNRVLIVQDRMHSRWGQSRIDIWMTTRAEALKWGIRTVTIEILS